MREVGIKALKDNLCQYIDLVKKGEIVIVKDRNKIVAEIRRPNDRATENLFVQEAILKGSIIPEKVERANIDGIIKRYSRYKLGDVNLSEIYESLKDK